MVQGVSVLEHLEDVGVLHRVTRTDAKGYQQTDVVLLHKSRQFLHLLAVQRTDNQVALGSIGVAQHLLQVAILRDVPCPYIGRNAVDLQTVARHQHATVVF